MTTLIIGGTGFIGRRLIPLLAKQGEDSVVMDINPQTANFSELAKVRVLRGDVSQFDDVMAAMIAVKPDRVINLAYYISSDLPPRVAFKLNILGMDNCFEAARLAGCNRVVYASSVAVMLVGSILGKAHGQTDFGYGEMESWATFDFSGIAPPRCEASATVRFTDFITHMTAVRETWLNRDYSDDFYRQRGMSTLAYVVAKKIGTLLTFMIYNNAQYKNVDLCAFRIYVLTQDDFGTDKVDQLLSWTFTRELANRINWDKFDSNNFGKIAQVYAFGPNIHRLTRNEPPFSSDQGGDAPEPAPAPSPGVEVPPSPDVKDLAVFTGQCRFQILKGFFPCDGKVVLIHLRNGLSA